MKIILTNISEAKIKQFRLYALITSTIKIRNEEEGQVTSQICRIYKNNTQNIWAIRWDELEPNMGKIGKESLKEIKELFLPPIATILDLLNWGVADVTQVVFNNNFTVVNE